MPDQKQKHLEMIQSVTTRMATNSFMIKGWSITLVSALFALAAKDADNRYVLISYFPIAMFWFLDGYFLFQERAFRKLYDLVRMNQSSTSDFSMDTSNLNTGDATWSASIISRTLRIFYGTMLLTICIIMLCLRK